MANRSELRAVLVVGALALAVASAGLYLGFHSPRLAPRPSPAPQEPDKGPILYEMRSVRSDPNRVRFEWREVPGASGYHVTVLTASDDSIFAGPETRTPYWTIPPGQRGLLAPHTVYHWRLTVRFPDRVPALSDLAAFATQ